ncbi:MAG TPA: alpha/beta fold hydrolase [Opitutaceae bacterium]|nr:alpha/beta fold hydrolase [Opitutaceae bacterium]
MNGAPLPSWLQRLYPFAPRTFATAGGAKLSYLDEGPRSDEAVLMVHGNPTWSFYYRDLVREISPAARCIVPDHVGMGLSAKPAQHDYTLAGRIADLEALVESLGLKKVHLVVHDWGGAIGFGWAARHPERVGKIVILNTAAFFLPRLPRRIALCRVPGLGALLVRGANAFAAGAATMAMHQRRLTREERRGYLYPYGSWADRIGVHRFVQDIPMDPGHPSRATLEAVAGSLPRFAPNAALILWGGRDFCFNDLFLRHWQVLYPAAEAVRLAEAGHYVLEEGGAEARALIRRKLGLSS